MLVATFATNADISAKLLILCYFQTQLLELTEDQIHSTLLMILLLPDIQRHSLQVSLRSLYTRFILALHTQVAESALSSCPINR